MFIQIPSGIPQSNEHREKNPSLSSRHETGYEPSAHSQWEAMTLFESSSGPEPVHRCRKHTQSKPGLNDLNLSNARPFVALGNGVLISK